MKCDSRLFIESLLWPLSQLRLALSKPPLPHDISIMGEREGEGGGERLSAGDEREDKKKQTTVGIDEDENKADGRQSDPGRRAADF